MLTVLVCIVLNRTLVVPVQAQFSATGDCHDTPRRHRSRTWRRISFCRRFQRSDESNPNHPCTTEQRGIAESVRRGMKGKSPIWGYAPSERGLPAQNPSACTCAKSNVCRLWRWRWGHLLSDPLRSKRDSQIGR